MFNAGLSGRSGVKGIPLMEMEDGRYSGKEKDMRVLKKQNDHLWSIVLAGGNGERLRPAIHQWFGHEYPKQFCTFVGTRSMLQHTIDRADRVTDPERRMTVVSQAHRHLARAQMQDRPAGTILGQPINRDTAPGIFLPLTYVRAQDEEAMVVVFPSDHFVNPEDSFTQTVQHAVSAAEWLMDRVVILGVQPDSTNSEYGWIQVNGELGRASGHQIRGVEAFMEKPDPMEWLKKIQSGLRWNTLVMASRVETLWKLGWQCIPEMMPLFETLGEAIGTSYEGTVLEAVYRRMPAKNFSSHLLARAPEHLAVLDMAGVAWSDWGSPERIIEDIHRFELQPNFSPAEAGLTRRFRPANIQLENAVQA